MFSGRNNVFIWLTGWNFSTFNVFHRHIARIATIQAIVHSIGYAAIEINCEWTPFCIVLIHDADIIPSQKSCRGTERTILVHGCSGM